MISEEIEELEEKEIDPKEIAILKKDYEYCTALKTRHLEPDLKEILDKINKVLLEVTESHH